MKQPRRTLLLIFLVVSGVCAVLWWQFADRWTYYEDTLGHLQPKFPIPAWWLAAESVLAGTFGGALAAGGWALLRSRKSNTTRWAIVLASSILLLAYIGIACHRQYLKARAVDRLTRYGILSNTSDITLIEAPPLDGEGIYVYTCKTRVVIADISTSFDLRRLDASSPEGSFARSERDIARQYTPPSIRHKVEWANVPIVRGQSKDLFKLFFIVEFESGALILLSSD